MAIPDESLRQDFFKKFNPFHGSLARMSKVHQAGSARAHVWRFLKIAVLLRIRTVQRTFNKPFLADQCFDFFKKRPVCCKIILLPPRVW